MNFLLLCLAAVAYVAGGIAMKHADGFRQPLASIAVFAAFAIGAALQTWAMRYQSLGVGYVLVLGLEAVLAVAAGLVFFHEQLAWTNAAGIGLIIVGIVMLKS